MKYTLQLLMLALVVVKIVTAVAALLSVSVMLAYLSTSSSRKSMKTTQNSLSRIYMQQLPDNFMDLFKEAYSTLDSRLDATTTTCKLFETITYHCEGCRLALNDNLTDPICTIDLLYSPYDKFLQTFDKEAFEKQYPEVLI